MKPLSRTRLRTVQARILRWYRRHGRDLPWRRTRDPYRILLSELMLQQTQVRRVETKYREFLRAFPTVQRLARSSRGTVLERWQGLGYNRRAIWLHDLAKTVSRSRHGRLPREYNALRELRGIGDYTARAIRCFAFGEEEPVVDVNIRRVLSRVIGAAPSDITPHVATGLLPPRRAYDWNQALMDIGSMFCTARKPSCITCPLSDLCTSSGSVNDRAATRKKNEPGRHGIPRRIYRGRILKAVSGNAKLSSRSLAVKVGLHTSASDLRWLRSVVEQLQREGMIELRSTSRSWSARKVA